VFNIDYWTSDIHISDNVLWYQGSYSDSIYKFNYEDLYQIPKRNLKDDCIFVQTDTSEVLTLCSPMYMDLTLKVNSRVEIEFNTTSRNRISLKFLDDLSSINNVEISPTGNDNFSTQIIETTITQEITFDQLQFDGSFNPSDNLIIDFIKIYYIRSFNNNAFNSLIPLLVIIGSLGVALPSGYYLLKRRKFSISIDPYERVKSSKDLQKTVPLPEGINKFVGYSILGAFLSIIFSLLIPIIYPDLYFFGWIFIVTLQILMVSGSLLTIAGAVYSYKNLKSGRLIVIIGAILGGGNIITLSSLKYLKE
jgi:hypothetical protein